jgi:hypothetical protein
MCVTRITSKYSSFRVCRQTSVVIPEMQHVTKAIGNNEERKENHSEEHKILTWKTLSNKER